VIPLLAERPQYLKLLDRVLVVDAPRSVQHARLITRDQITAAQADQMLASQASRDQRLAIADDILDNRSDSTDIAAQVAALDRYYRQLKH
jgi:dephospho-CoA kinase